MPLVKFKTWAWMPWSLSRTGTAPVKTLASIALSLSWIESIKICRALLLVGVFPVIGGVGDGTGAAATKEAGGGAGLGFATGDITAAGFGTPVGVAADIGLMVGAALGVADPPGGEYWLAPGFGDIPWDGFALGVCLGGAGVEGGELAV